MNATKKREEAIAHYGELAPEFFLYTPSGESWLMKSNQFILTKQDTQIVECRLIGQIEGNTFQAIESQHLFRYDSDTFGVISSKELIAELPINLTFLLAPECLELLEEQASTADQAIGYLKNLSEQEPTHLLLSTDSWLMLSIRQQQPQGEVNYRTAWDYLDWSAISLDDSEQKVEELLLNAIANFSKDAITRHLAIDPNYNTANPQVAQATTQLIETLFTIVPSLLAEDENPKEQLVNAITNVFTQSLRSQLAEYLENALAEDNVELPAQQLSEPAIAFQPDSANSIFETVVQFFQTQNWTVRQLPSQPILHFYFEGENGQWECYAQTREAQQQFIFYSVLPLKVQQAKYQAVAEYITRANYGMIIGNFEFDFNDGEIRYKTSTSINSSNLDAAVIEQLVFTNLLNTDKYLPGVIKIFESDILPEEVIANIEI